MCLNEGTHVVTVIIVLPLSIVVGALGIAAVCVPWMSYHVVKDAWIGLNGTNSSLIQLARKYPELFHSRDIYISGSTCFPDIDDDEWRTWFGKEVTYSCDDYGCSKDAFCLSVHNTSMKGVEQEPAESYYITVVPRLLKTTYAALVTAVVLSFLFSFACFWCVDNRSCTIFATAFFCTFFILKAGLILTAIPAFYFADNMESKIKQPPHYGFIQDHEVFSSVTSKNYAHGLPLTGALFVLDIIPVVLFMVVMCSKLRTRLREHGFCQPCRDHGCRRCLANGCQQCRDCCCPRKPAPPSDSIYNISGSTETVHGDRVSSVVVLCDLNNTLVA